MKHNSSKPNPLDLVDIDAFLSAEEKAVRAASARCETSIDPYVANWFERGELPVARELARSSAPSGCSACTSTATAVRA